ncbi:MAG: VWA domain-containing protein [Bacteroidetes bacterium]|nr:VWA domain-containing protein [Bacteroidota bacterium]
MKKFLKLTLAITAMLCVFMINGCDEDSNPAATQNVTQINANGSLAATSSTQASGTLVIADQNGSPITGLTSQNVTVNLVWGNMAQTGNSVTANVLIQSVSQSGKNIAVAMTMDYSGSMEKYWNSTLGEYQQIIDMENGVKTFVNALGTNDICEIIKFDSYVEVFQTFTSSKQALIHAVDSSGYFGGSTALYQSIYTGLEDLDGISSSSYARAVVAFTDGVENASSVNFNTMIQKANQNAIPVYTIGLFDSTLHTTPPGQYSGGERTLVEIADSTGGFYFYAPNAAQLAQIYGSISGQLANAYTITITWPTATLPASGTLVTALITVNYNGLISQFQRDFIMP